MPCVVLLLETQHSRLLEAAQTLAQTAGSQRETWPGDLYAFRQMLSRHDRMERDVFARPGVPEAADDLIRIFDQVLAAQPGLDPTTVASAARQVARQIEEHADAQEGELFPRLIERHGDATRHQLGDRYVRMTLTEATSDGTATAAA